MWSSLFAHCYQWIMIELEIENKRKTRLSNFLKASTATCQTYLSTYLLIMPSNISDLFEDSPGEFFISVEVFITNPTSVVLPKVVSILLCHTGAILKWLLLQPSSKSRKLEKRESVGDDLKAKGAYMQSLSKSFPIVSQIKLAPVTPSCRTA
jgi:hypothetical protein